jgi:hypothetical protein
MKQLMMLAACALALTACGNKLTNETLMKVKQGMSEAEVKNILGRPATVETGETLGVKRAVYCYTKGQARVQIFFVNHQVAGKSSNLE